MKSLVQDLRYGFRILLKSPSVTMGVIVSLALGIGLNMTIFSWVNALLLRPIVGVEKPEQLVGLYNTRQGSGYLNVCYPDYLYYRDHNRVFSGLIAFWLKSFAMSSDDEPRKVDGTMVSGNYFSVLGVKPVLGRFFSPEEDQTLGTHPVVVVSYRLWQRHFGSNPNAIGRAILLNRRRFTIVGVAPEGFRGALTGLSSDLWIPIMAMSEASELSRGPRMLWLMAIGRLRPGVRREQAQAEMSTFARQLEQAYPDTNKERGLMLTPIRGTHPALRGTLSAFLALLMGATGLILLITCTNVANLLLAKITSRRKEIVTRLTLGASRGRILRQLLTESVLLALLSGSAGLLIAHWANDFFLSLLPPLGIPFELNLNPDVRVFSLTVLLSLIAGIGFGALPALQATRLNLVQALKDEGAVEGYRKSRVRNLLVVAQVSMSLVLLIGAGLLVRSLKRGQAIDPGFDPKNILTLSFGPTLIGYDEVKTRAFYREVLSRVKALPGIQSASLAKFIPLGPAGDSVSIGIEGRGTGPGSDGFLTQYNLVGPDYFPTLGIPLMRGRAFGEPDWESGTGVVIINETMAKRYWPDEESVGKRLRIGSQRFEIIGVAKDVKYRSLGEEPRPFLYLFPQREAAQMWSSDMRLHVRTAADPRTVLTAIRSVVHARDPNLPISDAQSLTEAMRFALIPTQLAGTLLGISGLLALLLAAVGIYGVAAYSVSQRTREIGIRIALGAQPRDVVRLVVRQGMNLMLIGVAVGWAGAFLLTRLLSSLLYGVGARDPITFAGTSLFLAAVALLATYIPAHRASKIDPMVALRYE